MSVFPSQFSGRVITAYESSLSASLDSRLTYLSYLSDLTINNANDAELAGLGYLAGLPWPTEATGTFDNTYFIVTDVADFPETSVTQGFSGIGLNTGGMLSSVIPLTSIYYPSSWYKWVLPIIAELRYLGPSLSVIDKLMASFSLGYTIAWNADNDFEVTFDPALSTAKLTVLQRIISRFIVSPSIKIVQA